MVDTFCRNCGAKVDHTISSICPNCGEDVTKSPAIPVGQAPPVYGSQQPTEMGGVQYGGFWIRFGAAIIDSIIIAIPSAILALPFGDNWQGGYYLFYLVLGWIYYAYLESSPEQSTFGKRALGLVVTDVYGNRLDFTRASIRYVGRIVSTVILYLGFVLIAFSDKKQGLHDMIAGTLVVYKR